MKLLTYTLISLVVKACTGFNNDTITHHRPYNIHSPSNNCEADSSVEFCDQFLEAEQPSVKIKWLEESLTFDPLERLEKDGVLPQ
ncbi:MAG: hypothetical protein HWE14_05085 [Flavobacteriia bacterium]|nr:hypothetical protein [Flavobacteriia bacterium]